MKLSYVIVLASLVGMSIETTYAGSALQPTPMAAQANRIRNADGSINYGKKTYASEADYIESECQAMGRLGQSAAQMRQDGTSYEQALAIANYSNAEHQRHRPEALKQSVKDIHNVFVLLIEDAYAQPIYANKAQKDKEIQYRGENAYALCKEALPKGRAQAKQQAKQQTQQRVPTNALGSTKPTSATKPVKPTSKLPFIGTRYYTFEFWGGNGGEKITIKQNGDTTITYYNANAVTPIYKGKYTDPIITKSAGQVTRYKILGNNIMQVDKQGNIEDGCMGRSGETVPCVAELSAEGL